LQLAHLHALAFREIEGPRRRGDLALDQPIDERGALVLQIAAALRSREKAATRCAVTSGSATNSSGAMSSVGRPVARPARRRRARLQRSVKTAAMIEPPSSSASQNSRGSRRRSAPNWRRNIARGYQLRLIGNSRSNPSSHRLNPSTLAISAED
jgi:hypothetical protein